MCELSRPTKESIYIFLHLSNCLAAETFGMLMNRLSKAWHDPAIGSVLPHDSAAQEPWMWNDGSVTSFQPYRRASVTNRNIKRKRRWLILYLHGIRAEMLRHHNITVARQQCAPEPSNEKSSASLFYFWLSNHKPLRYRTFDIYRHLPSIWSACTMTSCQPNLDPLSMPESRRFNRDMRHAH